MKESTEAMNKEQLLEYIHEYAFEFARYFHLAPEKRDEIIKEKILTPEQFINLYL